MKRLPYIILFALLVLLPLMLILFITNYAPAVPTADSLGLVPLLQKMHSSDLTISDVWNFNANEHKTFFPTGMQLLLAKFTSWNIRYELYGNIVIVMTALLFIYLILRKTIGQSHPDLIPYLLIIFALMIFSPAPWESWLLIGGITIFLSVTAILGALWAVVQGAGKWRGILIAILFCFIASFSFSNGLISWIMIIGLLLFRKPIKWKHIILLCLAFAVTLILYYNNYTAPASHPLLSSGSKLWQLPLFFAAFIGAPIGMGKMIPSIAIGITLILAFIIGTINIWRNDKKLFQQFLPWIALACCSIASGGAIAFARVEGFGLKQALASRYITISMWLAAAVVIIAAIWLERHLNNIKTSRKYIYLAIVVGFLLVAGAVVIPYGKNVLNMLADRRNNVIECWENVGTAPDEWLRCLNDSHPEAVREPARILRKLGLIHIKFIPPFDSFTLAPENNSAGTLEIVYKEQSRNTLIKPGDKIKIIAKGRVDIPAKYVIIVSQNKVLARAELKENKRDWEKRFNPFTLPKGASEIRAYAVLDNEKDILLLKNSFTIDIE